MKYVPILQILNACFSMQSSKPYRLVDLNPDNFEFKKVATPLPRSSRSFSPSYFNSPAVQIIVTARVVSSKLINGFYRLNISMNY